jgi:hypothetical protein
MSKKLGRFSDAHLRRKQCGLLSRFLGTAYR